LENPNYDPWKSEIILWLDIMYGDGSIEEKAQKLLNFYKLTEFSVQSIIEILLMTKNITNISRYMESFFENFENYYKIVRNPNEYITINDWLNLYNNPTVPIKSRIVEMPDINGWNPYNWYAFEGLSDINWVARHVIGEANVHVIIGNKGELTDNEGRYWIAVGPNVMNPSHQPSEKISPEEMKYGSKVDVVLRHDDGTNYYLPCVIGDVKAHTWPNGILQTGYAFPNGTDPHPIEKPQAPIEFIGATLSAGLIDFEIVHIIVYD